MILTTIRVLIVSALGVLPLICQNTPPKPPEKPQELPYGNLVGNEPVSAGLKQQHFRRF